MKKTLGYTVLSLLALTVTACNEDFRNDSADVRASQRAVQKDTAAIKKYDTELQEDRAQKADAKARGDAVGQARESVEIGYDKAMKGFNETERKADQKILEEDREDLRR